MILSFSHFPKDIKLETLVWGKHKFKESELNRIISVLYHSGIHLAISLLVLRFVKSCFQFFAS